MNQYPQAFHVGLATPFSCDYKCPRYQLAPNTWTLVQQPLVDDVKSNDHYRGCGTLQTIPIYAYQSLYCMPDRAPQPSNQTNVWGQPQEAFHSWSNQRGYGNLVVATNDVNHNIVGRVSPWNRLIPLPLPTDTQVDIQMAWKKPSDTQEPPYYSNFYNRTYP